MLGLAVLGAPPRGLRAGGAGGPRALWVAHGPQLRRPDHLRAALKARRDGRRL